MTKPRVTIGLPVFNGGQFLTEAVQSLLSQDFEDFELLIADNASTDSTREICEQFAAGDARIRYWRNDDNIGAAANYNRVFQRASGEFFRWAAADDRCKPSHLSRCLNEFEQTTTQLALVYPRTTIIDTAGNPVEIYEDNLNLRACAPHLRVEQLLRRLQLCNAVFGLMRTEVLATTRLIGGYVASDQTLLLELALRGQFYEIDSPLFERRLHAQGSQFANESAEELAAWFAPRQHSTRIAPRSRLCAELNAAIWRAPISRTEKLRCLWQLQRCWLSRNWRVVGGELKLQLKDLCTGARA